MSELNILFPEAEEVRVNGRLVLINPVQLRHFELFGKVAGELMQVVSAGSIEQVHAYAQRNSRPLRQVLVATTSLWRWRVMHLPAPVAIQLMLQVIRANAGFFVQAQVAAATALDGLQSPSA
ncbi:hypothetical protein [Pseudomonas sp. UBA6310]|uniref:hypothetical protein n=1 Tax=Pseudomonas sp. UBA6310 TaxID=1947327 RepID=UPI00257A80B7|nr:hypothetical protein [Pseudomonas sp. UBA6310]